MLHALHGGCSAAGVPLSLFTTDLHPDFVRQTTGILTSFQGLLNSFTVPPYSLWLQSLPHAASMIVQGHSMQPADSLSLA